LFPRKSAKIAENCDHNIDPFCAGGEEKNDNIDLLPKLFDVAVAVVAAAAAEAGGHVAAVRAVGGLVDAHLAQTLFHDLSKQSPPI
jgi:hypothetical protein